jgi:cyclase
LDIKGPNLVKGIHLEGLRVLGKPERFARYYYENGADELFYMDTVASLYGRNSLSDIIEKTAREIFIPLTVGGGLRTIEDIRAVLKAGTDKVAINIIARMTKDKENKNLFCDFKQVLESVDFENKSDNKIALMPSKCICCEP